MVREKSVLKDVAINFVSDQQSDYPPYAPFPSATSVLPKWLASSIAKAALERMNVHGCEDSRPEDHVDQLRILMGAERHK
jgi:hypothetical protein